MFILRVKWRFGETRTASNKISRPALSDWTTTNRFAETVWLTNVAAGVGEGVAEVDGTAILKSALEDLHFRAC